MPQQAPTPSVPEPSATTDPTPAPSPTVEPSPNPTEPTEPTEPTADPTPGTEPTADPCPALPLAPLGDPGDAVRRVTLEPNSTTCFTVTVVKPGLHRVVMVGGVPTLTLSSGGTPVACPLLDERPCELAAGTYTLGLSTARLPPA